MRKAIPKILGLIFTFFVVYIVAYDAFGQIYLEKTELFEVTVYDKRGYIDQVSRFTGGIARVWIDCNPECKRRFIDKQGNFVRSPILDEGQQIEFREGLAVVHVGEIVTGKDGFIDNKGNFVIEPQFDYAIGFFEGLARVMMNHKFGFIDRTGKFVISAQFEAAWSFQNGLARIKV